MTANELKEVRKAIREEVEQTVQPAIKRAVEKGIPIAVAEVLSPLIADTVKKTISRMVWITRVAYLILAIACVIMFVQISKQADQNTADNDRQDCYLAGLVRRNIQQNVLPPKRRVLAVQIVHELEDGKNCNARIPITRAEQRGNP